MVHSVKLRSGDYFTNAWGKKILFQCTYPLQETHSRGYRALPIDTAGKAGEVAHKKMAEGYAGVDPRRGVPCNAPAWGQALLLGPGGGGGVLE